MCEVISGLCGKDAEIGASRDGECVGNVKVVHLGLLEVGVKAHARAGTEVSGSIASGVRGYRF